MENQMENEKTKENSDAERPLDKVPMQPELIGSVYPSLMEIRESFIGKYNKKLIK